MRIRKRTPARAASPVLSPSPLRPLMQQHPKDVSRDEEDDEAEEILVAGPGGREDVPVPVPLPVEVASKKSSAATDQPEEELWDARCNRNDGKRWRCKSAAVPGRLFCDRHVAWSARQRQHQARAGKKQMNKNSKDVFEPVAEEEEAEDKHVDDGSAGKPPQLVRRHDDGFYYYGGFQPGGRKRARGGEPGPVGGMN